MLKKLALLVSVFVLSLAFGYFIFAWTEPSQTPPGGNVPTPINVGDSDQVKSGKLGVATDGIDSSYGLTVGNSTNRLGIKSAGNSYFERNLSVMGSLGIGNFRLKPISSTELGIYDSGGNLILILD
jgi:hypothetical protein